MVIDKQNNTIKVIIKGKVKVLQFQNIFELAAFILEDEDPKSIEKVEVYAVRNKLLKLPEFKSKQLIPLMEYVEKEGITKTTAYNWIESKKLEVIKSGKYKYVII